MKADDPGRCCITDPQGWYRDPDSRIRKRFTIYRDHGCDTLRVEIDWRSMETREGYWDTSVTDRYLRLAVEYGFRLKIIVGVMMAPPGWFLDANPDAVILDETGLPSRNTLSYWYPKLKETIRSRTRRLYDVVKAAGAWPFVDFIIPAFGPAGEPIYPHPWTLGMDDRAVTFWCYAPAAQRDFRANMRRKYRTIAAANKAWGASFTDWKQLTVPKPGAVQGALWQDVLTWYRDSKRRFVEWQAYSDSQLVRSYTSRRIETLVYVPGTHYTDADWEEAVRTGRGNDWIKLMADSRWLIDAAAKCKWWLQYTGAENEPEVAALRRYLDARGYRQIHMWAENAGYYDCAKDPVRLAQICLKYNLWGLDLTHGHFLFEADGITPNAIMSELGRAFTMLRNARH